MSKVIIGFLFRQYSCYVELFSVDLENKFLIVTFGGIERMLIMVYGTVLWVDIFLLFLKSCSCLHFLAQSVVVARYQLPFLW